MWSAEKFSRWLCMWGMLIQTLVRRVTEADIILGILIRAGATFPVELYTNKRVAEFNRHNEQALTNFRFKK